MIRSFFEFQKEDKDDHYNKILLERSKDKKESVKMISIFQYMQAHDEFEIKANKLKQTKLDKYLGNLWIKEVDFTHRGNDIGNIKIISNVAAFKNRPIGPVFRVFEF
uniref:Uncharacterized protein n=1 Tax=Meloidogyne enterolobii TaxID=390850 RepID=A0A6V7WTB5_MELEN|nr:unnamed protein product [Meloidogyne enterolobii]